MKTAKKIEQKVTKETKGEKKGGTGTAAPLGYSGADLGEALADMNKALDSHEKKKGAISGTRQEPRPTETPRVVAAAVLEQVKRTEIAVVRNVRKVFRQEQLEELAASIRAVGILQPLVVRPRRRLKLLEPDMLERSWRAMDAETGALVESAGDHGPGEKLVRKVVQENNAKPLYELVAGERRWRAAELVGLDLVPCMVRAMSDAEFREIQRIENLQREDITAIEEAEGYREWMDEEKITADQVAERIQKSRSHVFARLKLLKLSAPVREAVLAGTVSQSIAELIARVPGEKSQAKALKEVTKGRHFWDGNNNTPDAMSFREAKAHIDAEFLVSLKGTVIDQEREYKGLKVCPGPCASCQFCGRNLQDEFPGTSPDVCTNPEGYAEKAKAALSVKVEELKAAGKPVLEGKEAASAFSSYYHERSRKLREPASHMAQASDACYELPYSTKTHGKSYKELLKDKMPEPVMAVDPEGHVRTVYRKSELKNALKTAGFKMESESRGSSTPRQTKEQKAKESLDKQVENLVDSRRCGMVVERIEKGKWKPEEVCRAIYEAMGQANSDDAYLDRREVASYDAMEKKMKGASVAQWLGLLWEMAVREWEQYTGEFEMACTENDIDKKKIEREVRAELEAAKSKKAEPPKGGTTNAAAAKKGKKK